MYRLEEKRALQGVLQLIMLISAPGALISWLFDDCLFVCMYVRVINGLMGGLMVVVSPA